MSSHAFDLPDDIVAIRDAVTAFVNARSCRAMNVMLR